MTYPDGSEFTVRIEGMDAAEKAQRFGDVATKWLAQTTKGEAVGVVESGNDRCG